MDAGHVALAAMGISATIAVADKFLPDLHEVRQSSSHATELNVRMGEIAVGAWIVGAAAYMAWACKSGHPLLLGVLGAVLLGGVYETALRSRTAQVVTHDQA